MGSLDGKVAIVTGAGRGIGRCEALLLASEGAKVVVNDLGGDWAGEGKDDRPAQQVVDEIKSGGGEAAANYDDVGSWEGAQKLVQQASKRSDKLNTLEKKAEIARKKLNSTLKDPTWNSAIKVNSKDNF